MNAAVIAMRHTPTIAEQSCSDISLELFAAVPPSCIVHAATDNRNAPLIRRGEIVVIESSGNAGWYPVEGGLFLIEYVSPAMHGALYERRSRDIVQTHLDQRGQWWAGSMRRGLATDDRFYCSDGPYRDEMALAGKLIGRVIGLLAPTLSAGRETAHG